MPTSVFRVVACALAASLLLAAPAHAAGRLLGAGDAAPEAELHAPGRRLLATRTVSGTVTWSDNNAVVSGALVKAYDNDLVGREFMGQATTSSSGKYTLSYTVKNWDFCCGGSKNPDIILEVYYGGRLYFKSAENSNIASSITRNIKVGRYLVYGKLYWQETCKPAASATVTALDEDIDADDTMGSTKTDSAGSFAISLPRNDGGSTWDYGISSVTPPDIYLQYKGPYGTTGQSSVKEDYKGTAINYGTVYQWRNDPDTAAKKIIASIGGDRQEYVSVTEFAHCNPKILQVTVKLDIKKATFSAPSDTVFARLKTLLKEGIAENWSRTGSRAINVPGKGAYDVHVVVVEDSKNGYSTSLKHLKDQQADCERSHNVGAPALGLDLTLWYNEGCARYNNYGNGDPIAWAEADFRDTAAHEWGHTVLLDAVSTTESWTHKGSSTLLQDTSDGAQPWPQEGDIDLMKKGQAPAGYRDRTIATDLDVRRLIGIAETTFLKNCGSCPFGAATPKSPPPPSPSPAKVLSPLPIKPPILDFFSPPPPDVISPGVVRPPIEPPPSPPPPAKIVDLSPKLSPVLVRPSPLQRSPAPVPGPSPPPPASRSPRPPPRLVLPPKLPINTNIG